ncbi:DegT/DnrJ/EryC1/StrS family aminotransferase [Telmatobacter sp. DSM 110680]|uniref:DegT/DnrJ/EryC1/StrS family aminotransferase n=1 Tax=Telmatobacter sp. DSM 110680 TaxID=3036704 RepID=A0AAU7DJB8_9BACT
MKVPLLDLKGQFGTLRNEILSAVTEVLESQICIGGPKVADLEKEIAAISDCKFSVGVSSGTDALLCSLMAIGIGSGDEVITTPFTFFATAGCISRLGAKPVFVDIDPQTYNIDPQLIESAITERTRAIIPVHLYGQMCDMDPIMEIANRHGLFVIEDAAQSITATYKGRKAGSIGTVGCFSFFPSKNLGAAGDAGMIVTNDPALAERMALMRSHGSKPKYYHKFVGGNFRLDPIQAAILLVKLPHLNQWSEARRCHARYYDEQLAGLPLETPFVDPTCYTIYNQYVVRVSKRDELVAHLRALGIGTEIYYPLPMSRQECFQPVVPCSTEWPQADRASSEVLALPIYPELTREMQDYVITSIRSFFGGDSTNARLEAAQSQLV